MKMQSKLKLATAPVAIGVALLAQPAMAQTTSDDEIVSESSPDELGNDEGINAAPIVVTGSRIVRPEVESVSPVTTIGAAAIDETGTTRVEDIINDLPQTVAGQTAFVSNGASGTATVNLRGLGTLRTLVLVDGRRLPSGDPFATAPDLNQIPAQLIERVEVVTGGASSVYGADAVAGVVNFIMDRDYEGFNLTGQVSFYNASNGNDEIQDLLRRTNNNVPTDSQNAGFTYDINATFGAGFDDGRGHITAYLGYREIDSIIQANYDESACALAFSPGDPTGFTCAGSSTIPEGRFLTFDRDTFAAQSLRNDPRNPGGLLPYTNANSYNYAPTNYYQRPDRRWTGGFFAEYEVNESIQPYAEFQYMDDRSVAQIAFSGTFFNNTPFLNCDNPLFSTAQRTAFGCDRDGNGVFSPAELADTTDYVYIGKRLVEGDPRQNDLRHTSYRAVLGTRGSLWGDWSYDVYALRGNTIYQNTYLNDLSVNRINQAIDAVRSPTGQIVCRDQSNGCVPLNVFEANGVTREAFDFIAVPGLQNADLETTVASGYITGPIGDWFGAGDISVVLGTEYRREDYELRVDQNFSEGTLAGQGGPTAPVSGSFNVREVFTEVVVPIIDGGFIDRFEIEGGFRYSDYSNSGGSETYKIGATLAPTDWLSFRGVYSRAVRAPNVVELFSPQNIGLFGGTDPCAGANPTATLAQCQNTGVTAAQYGNIQPNPANQYNQLGGGNPNLEPEVADSYTAGVVFEGDAFGLRGFALSVDYFNIDIEGTISGLGAQNIINQCIATGDPVFCSLIVRNARGGDLWLGSDANDGFVINTQQNIGGLKTEGLDINAGFNFPIFAGGLYLDYAGTITFENAFQTQPGADFIDCIGFYGSTCGQPQPEYSHIARIGYRADEGFSLNLSWRYFGATEVDLLSDDPNLGDLDAVQGVDELDTIDSYSWFDLSGSVTVADTITLTAGVNNIFDKKPPLIGGAYSPSNGNTYPGIYDPVGRQLFLRASLEF